MTLTILIWQFLLFGHVLSFALALAAVLKEDVRLLVSRRINSNLLSSTARTIKWLLLALWLTGVPMVTMDVGTDLAVLLSKPKLVAKIIVVTVLTLNGVLLHLIAFPMLSNRQQNPRLAATIASVLGAISTVSWLYASFVGLARIVAPHFSINDFLALYAIATMLGITFAIVLVRNRLERMLNPRPAAKAKRKYDYQRLALTFRKVETAIRLLGQVHERQRSIPNNTSCTSYLAASLYSKAADTGGKVLPASHRIEERRIFVPNVADPR